MKAHRIFYGCVIVAACILVTLLFHAIRLALQPTPRPEHEDRRNLRAIWLACNAYAMDHNGTYPPDWSVLTNMDLDTFGTRNEYKGRCLSNVMEWTDYVYKAGISPTSGPQSILAYSPPDNYDGKSAIVVSLLGVVKSIHRKSLSEYDFSRPPRSFPVKSTNGLTGKQLTD